MCLYGHVGFKNLSCPFASASFCCLKSTENFCCDFLKELYAYVLNSSVLMLETKVLDTSKIACQRRLICVCLLLFFIFEGITNHGCAPPLTGFISLLIMSNIHVADVEKERQKSRSQGRKGRTTRSREGLEDNVCQNPKL